MSQNTRKKDLVTATQINSILEKKIDQSRATPQVA